VQAIAEAHGGSVRVQSTFGHGSVFEVLVPLAPASVAALSPTR
jgi:signal transduction histidine kinase